MDIRKLQRAIVDGLEDVKAQDIVVYNTEQLSALFERVIIASGTSNRQTKALASSVRDKVREQGGMVLGMEGEDNGEWIIVDCGQAVAHIMQPAIRQYYHLEEIWGTKPVRMRLASEVRGLPKASEPEVDAESASGEDLARPAKAAPRRRAGSAAEAQAPVRKAAAKRRPADASGAPEAKAAAKTPARKKAAPRKRVLTSESVSVPVLVVPPPKSARKAPAKKAAATRSPARKVAAKKAAPAKSAARKTKPASTS